MAELFERWKKFRDEKNEVIRALSAFDLEKALSVDEAQQESQLVQRYNDLYAEMYVVQEQFTDEDWAAYDADQDEIRQMEYQAWLIENRYGSPRPPHGIADWWSK